MTDPVIVTDQKLIIRTSDRGQFRRCRQKWDFTSKIRRDWEYVPGIVPLDFGTAIHQGLEVYYDPKRWDDDRNVVRAESIMGFYDHMVDWRTRLVRAQQWESQLPAWKEHLALGKGMLNHYFKWAPRQDKQDGWEPVKVEIEFEVPIPVPQGFPLPPQFTSYRGELYKYDTLGRLIPVVYQGRIDMIIRNIYTGKIWVIDFKTAAQFGQLEHWETDTQVGSYTWVIKKILNLDAAGFVIQELRKDVPKPPRVLKAGDLSRAKNQGTTVEMYEKAIEEMGFDRNDYAEFIEVLRDNQTDYFRRITVDRTAVELKTIETYILYEALDMLGDPYIYPNSDRWNCNGCPFRTPCLMRQDGSDWEGHLKRSLSYEQRGSTE